MYQEEFERQHTSQEINDARLDYGQMMASMTRYSIEEFRMQKAMSPIGARKWRNDYMPKALATT